ncbi:MAG: sigma-E factor negative regulatory protein [Rhodanobacter sp.]|jgi:sigma-E factor negative regulatory protein RseA|nr:sigma-E factor negative regulatory protein [Rhodanobacter sp.]
MNQQTHEQLSVLMDGELDRDQMRFLLKRIGSDAELPTRWARYHVTRQVLRRQDVVLAPGFAAAVMARLDREPAVHSGRTIPWLRWGTGGAIAASVAVAALMLTRPTAVDVASPQRATAARPPQSVVAPVAAVAATSAAPRNEFRAPLATPSAAVAVAPASFGTNLVEPLAVDPQMQSYLIRHYQATGGVGAGPSNFVPYVLLGNQRQENATPAAAQNR